MKKYLCKPMLPLDGFTFVEFRVLASFSAEPGPVRARKSMVSLNSASLVAIAQFDSFALACRCAGWNFAAALLI